MSGRDLTVRPTDFHAFAEAWGHALRPHQAEQMHALTGGWPKLMQLVLDGTPASATSLSPEVALRHLRCTVMPELVDRLESTLALRLALPQHLTMETAAVLLAVWTESAESDSTLHPATLVDELVVLGVHDRRAALARAHQLGLLETDIPG